MVKGMFSPKRRSQTKSSFGFWVLSFELGTRFRASGAEKTTQNPKLKTAQKIRFFHLANLRIS
jgi:hypothetical protein